MLKNEIKEKLKNPLPGLISHIKMAPKVQNEPFRNFKPSAESKESAVMILLSHDSDGDLQVILTLRSALLSNHSGQISFPGGRKEPGESDIETALRETYEEIGVKPEKVEILGKLSGLFVPPSKSCIMPVVGWIDPDMEYAVNPDEVEELFFVKIKDIIDHRSVKFQKRIFNKREVDIPYWDVHEEVPLWGATAMIMHELLEVLKGEDHD